MKQVEACTSIQTFAFKLIVSTVIKILQTHSVITIYVRRIVSTERFPISNLSNRTFKAKFKKLIIRLKYFTYLGGCSFQIPSISNKTKAYNIFL